jgi:hypothetical protein
MGGSGGRGYQVTEAERRALLQALSTRQMDEAGRRWGPEGFEYEGPTPKPQMEPPPQALGRLENGQAVDLGTGRSPWQPRGPVPGESLPQWQDRQLMLPSLPPQRFLPEDPLPQAPNLPPQLRQQLLMEILRQGVPSTGL